MVNNFIELGVRLSSFGKEERSIAIINKAIADNHWFTQRSIRDAISSIAEKMLSGDKLKEWIARYPTLPTPKACNVLVVMAGNIPAVGFFDMLCTLAAGHILYIKPSRKDRVLIEYLREMLLEIDPSVPIYIYKNEGIDAVIATGGESANLMFRSQYAGVKSLLRGNRSSVAILNGEESAEQIELLLRDIYTHSGLGCRNVSMIFIPKGYKLELPKAEVSEAYRNNYRQQRALAIINGERVIDTSSSLLSYSRELPSALSRISLFEYQSSEEVERWLTEHDEQLQCVVSQHINHPRGVCLGESQSPTLFDYADAVDTMNFLANI